MGRRGCVVVRRTVEETGVPKHAAVSIHCSFVHPNLPVSFEIDKIKTVGLFTPVSMSGCKVFIFVTRLI